jgi:pilus assembly protein CpaC
MSIWSCLSVSALVLAGGIVLPGQTGVEDLRVSIGKSIVIDYPADIARISTSNPDIVDAVAVSTREILLHAKAHGAATVVVWAKDGQRNFYGITVEHNLAPIREVLKETFPQEDITIQSARDSITLTGKVASQEVSDRAAAIVASLAKTVVNNLQLLPGDIEKQILLRVKFAELDRDVASQFGFNLVSTGAANTVGRITTGQFQPPIPERIGGGAADFSITDALNIFAFRPDLNLAAFIKLLETQQMLQILAEPNLVTTNGKEASFLVGGEFPVPVLQGGSNAGAVTIMFREFGIRLAFNPKLTANKTIRMYVKPEVSTIDLTNAVTMSGFTIPALATRRMETNIELAEGQSFVIAGLLDDRSRATFNHIPGLASIPILGELFKSREKRKSKTELLVMVTPEIVTPLNKGEAKPEITMPLPFLEGFKPGDTMQYDGKVKAKEN